MTELVLLRPIVFGFALLIFSLLVSAGFGFFFGIRIFAALRSSMRFVIAAIAGAGAYALFGALFFVLWTGASFAIALDIGIAKTFVRLQFAAAPYFWAIAVPIFLLGMAAFFAICKTPKAYTLPSASRTRARLLQTLRFPATLLGCLALFLILARIPAVDKARSSEQLVAIIHAQKITLADVSGQNLPTTTNTALADKTVIGIDANHNGIRDDVELAISAGHPGSARIREAELQYAKSLQDELADVFDSPTLIAASQETSRAYYCLSDAVPKPLDGDWSQHDATLSTLQKEVEDLVLNTPERRQAREASFEKFMASHGDIGGPDCDVDLGSLPD